MLTLSVMPSGFCSRRRARWRSFSASSARRLANDTLDFLAEQVEKGTVFLIQPKVKSDVGRIEKNRDKLKALYEEGYRDGQDCYDDLLAFLKK